MDFLNELAHQIIIFSKTHQNWLLPIVFILSIGESLAIVSLFLPATMVLFAIGALISENQAIFLPVCISASLGAFIGDWLSYLFGYHYKNKVHHIWPFTKKPMMLNQGFFFFRKYGAVSVFIGRFFGPLRAIVPLIAGICAMNKRHFFVANLLSAIVWATAILLPGAYGIPWLKQLLISIAG